MRRTLKNKGPMKRELQKEIDSQKLLFQATSRCCKTVKDREELAMKSYMKLSSRQKIFGQCESRFAKTEERIKLSRLNDKCIG